MKSGIGGRDTAGRGFTVHAIAHNGVFVDSRSTNLTIRGAVGAAIPRMMDSKSTVHRHGADSRYSFGQSAGAGLSAHTLRT
jgi:hypothetical protein